VLAAQFGFLPGTLWLVIGVVLGGAVQDFTILFCSLRRDGKSLGQMAKEEVSRVTGATAMVAVLAIMIILLAVLALIVVNALRASPWGLFTIACTVPIALLMGWWMKHWRPGKVGEASAVGAGASDAKPATSPPDASRNSSGLSGPDSLFSPAGAARTAVCSVESSVYSSSRRG
jgi:carbon starvation protein CstA